MKRYVAVMLSVVLLVGAIPARASSPPVPIQIQFQTFGLELCPQAWCGFAIFAGVLAGSVNNNPAVGTFGVAVRHELPLPAPGGCVNTIVGAFEFRIGLKRIRGVVQPGGQICANTDPANTFKVLATLTIENGGGDLAYEGLLDHRVFPPTVSGPVVSLP
jgi:hypothetical protein